jgi:hypothetical protein
MMRLLHPTYTLTIEIKDVLPSIQAGVVVAQSFGPSSPDIAGHKYFKPMANKIGCDEVMAAVKDALAKAGIPATVSFDKFDQS